MKPPFDKLMKELYIKCLTKPAYYTSNKVKNLKALGENTSVKSLEIKNCVWLMFEVEVDWNCVFSYQTNNFDIYCSITNKGMSFTA